jgi:predicted GNAT family acetyltransferase
MAAPIGEVLVNSHSQPILLNLDEHRFEIRVDQQVAFLLFRLRGVRLSLIHIEVPPNLQHQGLADALARTALEYARNHSLSVKAICPFVVKFLAKHPEFQDVAKTQG